VTRFVRQISATAAIVCVASGSAAVEPPPADRAIFAAMQRELGRATRELALPNAPRAYYVGYWVVDEAARSVEATLGTLVSDTFDRDRFVKVEVRVGSRAADNSNMGSAAADGDFVKEAELLAPRPTSVDDDELAIRRDLWLATDAAYKGAVEALERKHAEKQSEIAARGEIPSFSTDVSSTRIVEDPPEKEPSDPRDLARRVSAVFRTFPELQKTSVRIVETRVRRRFLSSDGGLVVEPSRFAGVELDCRTQAPDGMSLSRSSFLPASDGGQVAEAQAVSEARRVASQLVELRTAKTATDYSGPVLFEGKAAAQLVYELLGESLSGTPPPDTSDLESPLSRKLGKRILPPGFNVVDDPTLVSWGAMPLLGHYFVDDEGIAAERTILAEDGRLRSFLMSRAPREELARSNGHGRSGLVGWARGRVGNLVVSVKNGLSRSALRSRFLRAVRDEDAEFGVVIEELAPRTSASSGELMPNAEVAYRVDLDGTETLLRGVELAPMSVRDLRDVLAAGRDEGVYDFVVENDGGLDLPGSVVAPALLFEEVEIRGPTTPNKRPPIVPMPAIDPSLDGSK